MINLYWNYITTPRWDPHPTLQLPHPKVLANSHPNKLLELSFLHSSTVEMTAYWIWLIFIYKYPLHRIYPCNLDPAFDLTMDDILASLEYKRRVRLSLIRKGINFACLHVCLSQFCSHELELSSLNVYYIPEFWTVDSSTIRTKPTQKYIKVVDVEFCQNALQICRVLSQKWNMESEAQWLGRQGAMRHSPINLENGQ